MIARIAASAALIALAGGCAASTTSSETAQTSMQGRQCFYLSQISGYTHAGRDRIHVSTGPGSTYEFEVFGPCPWLEDAETMGFDQAGGGTICSGIDVDLIVPTPTGPQRCAVRMIRKLPADGN